MSYRMTLAGNPNCGKSTLFNMLTGSKQTVGNWPGVTVEKKTGKIIGHDADITDLPGIYSLSASSTDEAIAKKYLESDNTDVIINVVDATNLERNLYLTVQLTELKIPMIILLNMIDIVEKSGQTIDSKKLSSLFGCTVCKVSALTGKGLDKAVALAIKTAEKKAYTDLTDIYGYETEYSIKQIENHLFNVSERLKRRYAILLFERDNQARNLISDRDMKRINSIIRECEIRNKKSSENIIADSRYAYATKSASLCRTVNKQKSKSITDKIDRIVTHKILAYPIFFAVMFLVFYTSVTLFGTVFSDFISNGIFKNGWSLFGFYVPSVPDMISVIADRLLFPLWLREMLIFGIIPGLGSVLSFIPQLAILFFQLSFLEGSGYMSRIVYITDRFFRRFGLSGKSFIPLLAATGCGVTGILSSRTISNNSEREITVMSATFMPCGAKLPLIALITGSLFRNEWWAAPSAYFIGVITIILGGSILKKAKRYSSAGTGLILELPPYRIPSPSNLIKATRYRTAVFIKKAGRIILPASVAVWFLSNYGVTKAGLMHTAIENSILVSAGKALSVLFSPLGWDDWRLTVSMLTGIIAKENIVGTLGVLTSSVYGSTDFFLSSAISPAAAYSFMAFNLLCVPCAAAVAAMHRELGSIKKTVFAVLYQCITAYTVSLMVFQLSMLINSGKITVGFVLAVITALTVVWLALRPIKR